LKIHFNNYLTESCVRLYILYLYYPYEVTDDTAYTHTPSNTKENIRHGGQKAGKTQLTERKIKLQIIYNK